MKILTLIATCLVANICFAQKLETIGLEEKVPVFKKTIKRYFVLKENQTMKHGPYREYFKKDLVVEGNYKLNKKESYWVYQSPDKKYVQKGSYLNGKKIGYWFVYLKGNLATKEFYNENSRLDTIYRYDLNENLTQKYYYNQDEKIAYNWIKRYNGFTEESTNLDKGKLHGTLKIFHPNGQLFIQKKYYQGKLCNVSDLYDHKGNVIRKSKFENGTGVLWGVDLDNLNEGKVVGVKSVTYKDSVPNGMTVSFDDKEKLLSKGLIYKNQKVGMWQEWVAKENRYKDRNYKSVKKSTRLKDYFETTSTLERPVYVSNEIKEAYGTSLKLMELYKTTDSPEFYKKEFSKRINEFITESVNIHLLSKTRDDNKKGVAKIYVMFKINTAGEAEDVKVKGVNVMGVNHIKSVVDRLPTFIPLSWQGTLYDLKFSLPVVFRIE